MLTTCFYCKLFILLQLGLKKKNIKIMKSKLFKFDMVIYPFPVLVSKSFDWKELEENFWVVTGKNTCEDFNGGLEPTATRCAHTCEVVSKSDEHMYYLILLYIPDSVTAGTMAHEAGHVSTFLGDRLGFQDRNFKNDEPYAYLDQFVADCIDSVMRDNVKKMNGKLFSFKAKSGPEEKKK